MKRVMSLAIVFLLILSNLAFGFTPYLKKGSASDILDGGGGRFTGGEGLSDLVQLISYRYSEAIKLAISKLDHGKGVAIRDEFESTDDYNSRINK